MNANVNSIHIMRRIPRFAQANIGSAVVVAEGYIKAAIGIKGATIETDIFLESLEEKSPFVDGRFYFTRHGNRTLLVDRLRRRDTWK